MAMTAANFSVLLKRIYPSGVPQDVATRDRAWLKMVPKKGDFYGEDLAIPIIHTNPQGRSATAANAYTAGGAQITYGEFKRFLLSRKEDFGSVEITGPALMASTNDAGAFVSARKQQVVAGLDQMGESLSNAL